MKTNKLKNIQRNVQKIGDSYYVRVGADEMKWLDEPQLLNVSFENIYEECTEVTCPKCKTKIVIDGNGIIEDTSSICEDEVTDELNHGGNK